LRCGRYPELTWNAKLLTTAGLTHYKKVTRSSGVSEYHARIELSTKVLDTAEKLEGTLIHEMCHAAAWLVDHCAKPPHGAVFKKWASKAMAGRDIRPNADKSLLSPEGICTVPSRER
jgi:predicted SprT family Zn-dependent metalloprotease